MLSISSCMEKEALLNEIERLTILNEALESWVELLEQAYRLYMPTFEEEEENDV